MVVNDINDMLIWIEEHIYERITIELLEKKSGYSKWHFQRIFFKLTGVSVGRYIRARKLTHSVRDLLITNYSIAYISDKYGFKSHQAYTRLFTHYFSIPPSVFRKERVIRFIELMPPMHHHELMTLSIIRNEFYEVCLSDTKYNIMMNSNGDTVIQNWKRIEHQCYLLNGKVCTIGLKFRDPHLSRYGTIFSKVVTELTKKNIDNNSHSEKIFFVESGMYIHVSGDVPIGTLHRVGSIIYDFLLPGLKYSRRKEIHDILSVKTVRNKMLLHIDYLIPVSEIKY